MNAFTRRTLVLLCGVSVGAPALAQDTSGDPDAARALDLTVPAAQVHIPNTADYRNDPPGTWYGDAGDGRASDANHGDWQVHGSVGMGVGWSNHGGNSNWQAANLDMAKAYTTDEGNSGHVGLSISVGQYDGPAFGTGGYFVPSDYYGPADAYGPESRPMPMRMRPGPGPRGH